jgi:hypothetical protein
MFSACHVMAFSRPPSAARCLLLCCNRSIDSAWLRLLPFLLPLPRRRRLLLPLLPPLLPLPLPPPPPPPAADNAAADCRCSPSTSAAAANPSPGRHRLPWCCCSWACAWPAPLVLIKRPPTRTPWRSRRRGCLLWRPSTSFTSRQTAARGPRQALQNESWCNAMDSAQAR